MQEMALGRTATGIALGFTLIFAGPIRSENPVQIDIRPALTTAPGTFRVAVQIVAHEGNRELVIEADSPDFYRASYIPFDGEYAARSHALVLKGLPAGRYTITARLRGCEGERAADSMVVDVLEG
jgi:hypothetical protein